MRVLREFMIENDGDGGSEIALTMTRMHFTCIRGVARHSGRGFLKSECGAIAPRNFWDHAHFR